MSDIKGGQVCGFFVDGVKNMLAKQDAEKGVKPLDLKALPKDIVDTSKTEAPYFKTSTLKS